MPFRKRGAQTVGTPVRVAVQLAGRALERFECLREGAERAFVRGELDHALEAELALHLFDRLPRLVRNHPGERGPDEAGGYVRH